MKKIFCFFAVLGVVVLTSAVSALPVANAGYWCGGHRGCYDRPADCPYQQDCPYWQDGQDSRYGHHHHRG